MARCEKCGCKLFLVDETVTFLEIDGEAEKEMGRTSFFNRNCLKCTVPDVYKDYQHLDEA